MSKPKPDNMNCRVQISEGCWIQDQMLEVKPSKQFFDETFFGGGETELFINVLDRKMPARDKGSTKSVRLHKMMLKMQDEVH